MNTNTCPAVQRLMNHLKRDCREARERLARLEGMPRASHGEQLNRHHAQRQQACIVLNQAESQLEYALIVIRQPEVIRRVRR